MISGFYSFAQSTVRQYLKHHVSRASAGLSYFLMLTFFPLLICLYNMLGSFFPSADAVGQLLSGILPDNTVETIKEFIGYVSVNTNPRMLPIAVAAMLTGSAAGFRIILSLMDELRPGRRRRRGGFLLSFAYSLVFLIALYLAALMMISGEWFIKLVDEWVSFVNISHNWGWFRFVALFLMLFVLILGVYRLCAPMGEGALMVPGALAASITLVGVSIVFSWFIGMSVKYPLVYGSLASMMILLLWLYFCGNILFLGGIVNLELEKLRDRKKASQS